MKERLVTHFKSAPTSTQAFYVTLWEEHLAAKLVGHHFVAELTGQSEEKLRQRLWEMALGRHLRECGHEITTRPEGEPDFRFMTGGQVVWVEATSPSPGPDLPLYWTRHDPSNLGPSIGSIPNREMLLRWTSAFKAKAEKCLEYRLKGIVGASDAFVIAIDCSQLSKFPHTHGISERPFVVETVFAVGPIEIPVDSATGKLGKAFQKTERIVENRNKKPVHKEPFFRPEYSIISAVLGCYSTVYAGALLPIQVAYNPLAQAPIAPGILGINSEEWIAELKFQNAEGQYWSLGRL